MNLPRPSPLIPPGVSPGVAHWMRSVGQSLNSAVSMHRGPLGVGGVFPSQLPGDPADILAIIGAVGGTGSGAGSGIGVSASDQPSAYEWVEGIWSVAGDDLVVTELEGGRFGTLDKYPALESNGNVNVPIGAVVRLKQVGAGVDAFYEFTWCCDLSTGSGSGSGGTSGNTYSVVCPNTGVAYTVRVNGTQIIFTEV